MKLPIKPYNTQHKIRGGVKKPGNEPEKGGPKGDDDRAHQKRLSGDATPGDEG